MGNAACTIHHPTSLEAQIPYLESGKILEKTTSLIRFEKRDGAAVGVGGRVVFKKNIVSSNWAYKYSKQSSMDLGLEIGKEITMDATDKEEAMKK